MTGSESDAAFDLLTIGETMVLIAAPLGSEVAYGGEVVLGTAGADANVAIGAAMLGLSTAWYSRVGADTMGDVVLHGVGSRGVDVASVRVDPDRPTGLLVKSTRAGSSRVDYYRHGSAASAMAIDDLTGLPSARVVHTTGVTAALSSSCHDMVSAILNGRLSASATSFDVNYRPSLWSSGEHAAEVLLDMARRADIVFVGRDEAELLWGAADAHAVRRLLPTTHHLVVKDADRDATEFEAAGATVVTTPPVEVLDLVGAGDAFAAGWLTAFVTGESASNRLAQGHALAAAALRSPTDQPLLSAASNAKR